MSMPMMFLNFIALCLEVNKWLTKLNTLKSFILGLKPEFLFEAYSIKLTEVLHRRIGIEPWNVLGHLCQS